MKRTTSAVTELLAVAFIVSVLLLNPYIEASLGALLGDASVHLSMAGLYAITALLLALYWRRKTAPNDGMLLLAFGIGSGIFAAREIMLALV